MSLTTPALARANLDTALSTVSGVTVLDYEPFGAAGTYVSVFFDGYDANYWRFTIRVYASIDGGAREAQVALDVLLPQIEDALASQWGEVNWSARWDDELQRLVAEWSVSAGREDF